MIYFVLKEKNFIPNEYKASIFEVDFKRLYREGIRLILVDLDNTLIPYDEQLPNEKLFQLKKDIKALNMELIIVSNSRKNRVKMFSEVFDVPFQAFSTKPLKRGIKKAIKKASKKYNKNEMVLIGDQLMTDVYAGNRFNIYTILVKALKRKSEVFSTKMNRKLERHVLKCLKKKFPLEYDNSLKMYEEENHG